jgi:hypothetical protein
VVPGDLIPGFVTYRSFARSFRAPCAPNTSRLSASR